MRLSKEGEPDVRVRGQRVLDVLEVVFEVGATAVAGLQCLEFHNDWRTRYAPAYLGSLPFGADPDTLAASPEFSAVTDAVESCAPEPEDPDAVTSRTVSLAMTIDPAFAATLRG